MITQPEARTRIVTVIEVHRHVHTEIHTAYMDVQAPVRASLRDGPLSFSNTHFFSDTSTYSHLEMHRKIVFIENMHMHVKGTHWKFTQTQA